MIIISIIIQWFKVSSYHERYQIKKNFTVYTNGEKLTIQNAVLNFIHHKLALYFRFILKVVLITLLKKTIRLYEL